MAVGVVGWLCGLSDVLDSFYDPFDEFTRVAELKDTKSKEEKAREFRKDLEENFLICGETIMNYRIPQPGGSPLDLGDQALWHGIATGIEARFRGSRTAQYLEGMASHQPGGHLIRGIDCGRIAEDASNDQATGHLFGLYGVWVWGQEVERRVSLRLMDEWAGRILSDGDAMTDKSGRVTTYGRFISGWKTDPLRVTLVLAIYGAAWVMTGAWKYKSAYVRIWQKYGGLIPYAKMSLWGWDTSYDTHRAAIHLAILATLNLGDQELIRRGLIRLRKKVRKHGNVWVNALCAWGLGAEHPDDKRIRDVVLSEFTLEDKQYNVGKVNSTDATIRKVRWNGQWVSRQPLPRWRVSAQDFFWQRGLFNMDFRGQGSPADSRYNGLDFLAAYEMSRG